MKRTVLPLFIFLFAGMTTFAQKSVAPPPAKEQTQNIVIRKKGGDKEKMTIVIDGDNITVNGKPLKDFKGDIRITENDGDLDVIPPLPPMPAIAANGGTKSFSRDFYVHQNSAFLGVYTEGDDDGARVKEITKNSPADKAGLKEGDIITKVGDDKIEDGDDLMDAVGKYKPADKVTVTYLRDKKENSVPVTLEKNTQSEMTYSFGNKDFMNRFNDFSYAWNDDKPRLGMRVEDVETGTGVKVTDVGDEDSPAAKAGLKEDDVITQINGKTVATVKDAKELLADVKRGDDVTISYQRKGIAQTATVHIPKPVESSDL